MRYTSRDAHQEMHIKTETSFNQWNGSSKRIKGTKTRKEESYNTHTHTHTHTERESRSSVLKIPNLHLFPCIALQDTIWWYKLLAIGRWCGFLLEWTRSLPVSWRSRSSFCRRHQRRRVSTTHPWPCKRGFRKLSNIRILRWNGMVLFVVGRDIKVLVLDWC